MPEITHSIIVFVIGLDLSLNIESRCHESNRYFVPMAECSRECIRYSDSNHSACPRDMSEGCALLCCVNSLAEETSFSFGVKQERMRPWRRESVFRSN